MSGLLRKAAVLSRVQFSRATLYRRMEAGEFPLPVSIGGRSVAWREAEVDRWIAELAQVGGAVKYAGPKDSHASKGLAA